jgi:gamma-glutamylaminecyclotransferase
MESGSNRDFETMVIAIGTLKRGFALHERGLAGARYLGPHRTVEPYPMMIAGPWFAPMVLDRPGEGLRLLGELYAIDETILVRLDALESVGQPGNFRRRVTVESLETGAVRPAYCFMKAAELAHPVHSGWIADYQDRRFIPPERRGRDRHYR